MRIQALPTIQSEKNNRNIDFQHNHKSSRTKNRGGKNFAHDFNYSTQSSEYRCDIFAPADFCVAFVCFFEF